MNIITIKKIEYVECSHVFKIAPIFSKGSRSTRSLIKNKKIPENMYIFAKQNKEGNWIKTEGASIKIDKILLKKEYLENIPELQENAKNELFEDNYEIQKAPEVIKLNNAEKFKDNDNRILEIETRGKRDCNNIYI